MDSDRTNGTQEDFNISLNLNEINLILEALGQLPFVRVHTLISAIQQQATQQLQEKK